MKSLKELRKKQPEKEEVSNLTEEQEEAAREINRARKQARLQQFREIIQHDNVYFIVKLNDYMYLGNDPENPAWREWINASQAAINMKYMLSSTTERAWFKEALHELDKVKDVVVNTFEPTGRTVLNMMIRSGWLTPIKGDVPEVFNVLFNSLSGGRQEVIDHLEKVIVWKYLHPEDVKIPCVSISGKAGVGKNELFDLVFATLVGSEQARVVDSSSIFGTFNGIQLGTWALLIDEAIPEKSNQETLKRLIGNKTMSINTKYGMQGVFANTPMRWIGGNGNNGNFMLSAEGDDRRFSPITVTKDLMYWVSKSQNLELDEQYKTLDDKHPCLIWWKTESHKLKDPIFVAHWLDYILTKWKDQKFCPSALRVDYEELVESQKNETVEVAEWVFNDRGFEHIEKVALYELYLIFAKNNTRKKSAKTFHADIRNWLMTNEPGITLRSSVKIARHGMGPTSGEVYMQFAKSYVKRNTEQYIEFDEQRRCNKLVEKMYVEPVVDEQFVNVPKQQVFKNKAHMRDKKFIL